jgi:hypothetical protein
VADSAREQVRLKGQQNMETQGGKIALAKGLTYQQFPELFSDPPEVEVIF